MQYGKLISTIFALVLGAVISVYILLFYWEFVLLVAGVAVGLIVLYLAIGAFREASFSKELIRNIQNGRRVLSSEDRRRWNEAVKANMKGKDQRKVEKRKKVEDIDPTEESS